MRFLLEIDIEVAIVDLVSKGLMHWVTDDFRFALVQSIDHLVLCILISQVFRSRDVLDTVKINHLVKSIQARIEFSNLR